MHAGQLRLISEQTDAARVLTLALGRIGLAIRNFLEHGTEEPRDDRVLIVNEEYWATTRQYDTFGKKGGHRQGKPVSLFEWVNLTAGDLGWTDRAKLPATLPNAATVLSLDVDSLCQCLVLASLLLHGARAHIIVP